jgi:hypothetical protein
MKRGNEALNASSLQFLSSIKHFISSSLQFFLSVKHYITITFIEKHCSTLHRCYFLKEIPLLFKRNSSLNASVPLLFKVTLPTSEY